MTDQEIEDEIQGLRDFQAEVWGWLRERGLVDDSDDEWAGFKETIEEHEEEIAAAARRDALREFTETSGDLGTAAWVFTRPNDPTYPRLFTDRTAAAAHLSACTVGPIPEAHLVRLPTHPTASVREDLLRGIEHYSGPAPRC